ncbi:phytochrome A-associated F-box protein [Iris pallida]|uniref:Phytochrome A-associated F-box protein n=1 Tax=Iris pallida TaxID=29817 RepID=A0AAX6FFF4_IRIPA|nr:phytochrome A-associated F-box protein [Iris pallida]
MAESSSPTSSSSGGSSIASSSAVAAAVGSFSLISDDIVLNILAKLESDPRDWARLSCVSPRFCSLVRDVCCRLRCSRRIPSLLSDLGDGVGCASLHKLSVCCPGLLHAGVLLESSDFGLEREIGPDHSYSSNPSSSNPPPPVNAAGAVNAADAVPPGCWSLFDDLYLDTVYDSSEAHLPSPAPTDQEPADADREPTRKRRRHPLGPAGPHLASGAWNLSREQGNKLLASRFRGDSLYICDWPGCVHAEERRSYMLFRGVFKDFKRSRVWRTINDGGGHRGRIGLECAFCGCNETWDLHSAFCLRRVYGFHDDGEPVVRAYVCENGHVSGAWTERPMYT